jgi:hypothetical protein
MSANSVSLLLNYHMADLTLQKQIKVNIQINVNSNILVHVIERASKHEAM